MEQLLECLRASGEPTRIRIIHILSKCDLTVTEITQILGQSQPRVSRHLKLLCDAGLIERIPEGTWAFFRLSDHRLGSTASSQSETTAHKFSRLLTTMMDDDDPIFLRDLERLYEIKLARTERAAQYFEANASDWDRIRALQLPESDVEQALLELAGTEPIEDLVDMGTGTGRILEVLSNRVKRGIGLDSNREMLTVARANIERAGLTNCHVRQGDIFAPPLPEACADLIVIHQVLHFLSEPRLAVTEAARLLRANGIMIIVDFKPHHLEFLRNDHAHRRLGFSDQQVQAWFEDANLNMEEKLELPPANDSEEQKLTVGLWKARRRTLQKVISPMEAAQ